MDDKIQFVPKKIKIIEQNSDTSFKFAVCEEGIEYHDGIQNSRSGSTGISGKVNKERIIGLTESYKKAVEIAELAINKRREDKSKNLGRVLWEVEI